MPEILIPRSFRLRPADLDLLRRICEAEDRSQTNVVRRALLLYAKSLNLKIETSPTPSKLKRKIS